jgi:MFS family permease
MGVFSFVGSGGGTLGVIFGGALTQALGWQSIFVVNLPIGAGVLLLAPRLLDRDVPTGARPRLDVPGAILVTGSIMLGILGCVRAGTDGWGSATTLGLLGAAAAAMVAFVAVEARVSAPLVPLGMFRSRAVSAANGLSVLLRAAMFSWFFFSALYLQRVLGFSALETGLGFLPATLVIGAFSYSLTARIVGRMGMRAPFVTGTALLALGLGSFALAPVGGSYVADVLPGMLLMGVGGGMLFLPLLLTATTAVAPQDAGVASGLVSTSQQLGGALGLAVLAAVAAARTEHVRATEPALSAMAAGFHVAFLAGAALAALAAVIGLAMLPAKPDG